MLKSVSSISPIQNSRPSFETIPVAQFASLADCEWIIKDTLPKAELAVIYGEPGCGKTFLALDACMSIARGIEWEHQRTTQGRVVYICAEGLNGFKKRTLAYLIHHQLIGQNIPFDVVADAPDFLTDFDAPLVADSILKTGAVSVIVVDTFSRVMPGGNENSGEDMGHAIQQCKALHKLTGAIIILIHHSGKDAARGARGWSGLLGACDTEIEVRKIGKSHKAKITKQKDGEMGHEWGFDLKVVELGTSDISGDLITTCVYQSTDSVPLEEKKDRKLGGNQKIVYEAFSFFELNANIPMEDFITVAVKGIPHDPQSRDQRRQIVIRALNALKDRYMVDIIDNYVSKI